MNVLGLDETTIQAWLNRVAAEHERQSPPANFPPLPPLPPGRYTDRDFFAQEQEEFWQRTWLYAAHTDQLPEPGSFIVWSHGSAPILIIRGDDGTIRAFYNTCRHRGAPLARTAQGQAPRSLVCGYHGWRYNRGGEFEGPSEARDWQPLDPACHNLVGVRCEIYGSWIFVCEDLEAEPLATFLAPVSRFFSHLPFGDLRLVNQRSFEVACNYKVLIENFLEAYHFNLLHPRTTHRIFDNKGTNIHLWEHGHSMMLSPNRRSEWIDPGTLGMPEMAGSTRIERECNPSYCVFPNLIVPIAPTGMPCVAIWPTSVDTSTMDVLWFAPDWGTDERDPLWDSRIENFDRIVDEDIQLAEPMQKTIESKGFLGVPLSYQERRIYHWHEELDRRIGLDKVPAPLRVRQQLATFVE